MLLLPSVRHPGHGSTRALSEGPPAGARHHRSAAATAQKHMELREHTITLRGDMVLLRPMRETDWNILLAWNNDPEVLYFSEGDEITSYTLEEMQPIYCDVSHSGGFCFIIEVEGKPIGECWLQRMNIDRLLRKHASQDCRRIDLMIGEKEFWGRGIGTDVIRTLTKFGFEREKADMIFGCVADYNQRSLRAFQKVGYRLDARSEQAPGNKAQYVYDLVLTKEDFRRKS
jgi:RimJ/RimL family protein N-acetyltransferase